MAFRERVVEADGFRIRCLEAGAGPPLVHLHGAGGLSVGPAHDLLARRFRVIVPEMPGFGPPPGNTRTRTMSEMAAAMEGAIASLGLDRVHLLGTSFGAITALWLALSMGDRVTALVLEAPAAIRQPGALAASGSPGELARRLYAHPERAGAPPLDRPPHVQELVERLRGPDRDPELERRLPELAVPTLVLFGTEDALIDPAMGRVYKELLPNGHLVFVYDAGHAISAERPEAFAEVVGDFLDRGEAFAISRARSVIHP